MVLKIFVITSDKDPGVFINVIAHQVHAYEGGFKFTRDAQTVASFLGNGYCIREHTEENGVGKIRQHPTVKI